MESKMYSKFIPQIILHNQHHKTQEDNIDNLLMEMRVIPLKL